MKHLSPQQAINTFWHNFNSQTPGKASTILPQDVYANKASDLRPRGAVSSQSVTTSYLEATEVCKSKVQKIVKECKRVNQKYRDPHFDIEFDLKWGRRDCLETLPIPNKKKSDFKPQSVKRVSDIFDDPQFYIGGPTVSDIRQGKNGDCWFMAALCILGNKQSLIEQVCVARDEKVGVYGFVFYRDGEWRSEIIDDKLYISKPDYDESFLERLIWDDRERISSEEEYRKAYQSNSGALYFAQCEDPNETWLPLLEKAYAKAHGDYAAIEGGFTGEGIEDLTGGVTTEIFTTDILDKEHFWKEELMKVNEDFLFGCCTGLFKGWGERKGIQENHSYSIIKAVEIDGMRLLLLKNPWGRGEWTGAWSDGSKEWTAEWLHKLDHRFGNDGAFWIRYEDLLRKYQSFDRSRIFSPEWNVAEQWTQLQIPWTINYHDIKFEIVLEKDAPVVIVLSQLDGRYFRGLENQYQFELSFRLHRAGDDDYIVRSHGNYCMRRSVSVDLNLKRGTYHVLLKVRADRDSCCNDPVEKVVRDNCKSRRDKLLRIGLSYDLAHSKGATVETVAEQKAKEAAQARKKTKEQEEVKEKLMKSRNRSKHIKTKLKKKAKAKAAKQNARAAAETAKTEAATKDQEEQAAYDKTPTEEAKLPPANGAGDCDGASDCVGTDEKATEEQQGTAGILGAPPKADKLPPQMTINPKANIIGTIREYISEYDLSPTTVKTKLFPPSADIGDVCGECSSTVAARPLMGNTAISYEDDSDNDSVATDVTMGTVESEMERVKTAKSEAKKCSTSSSSCSPKVEEEDEFQRDPWNAWCVVGLRVYSKEAEVRIQVITPKTWEDGETSLDVDDSAVDACKHTVVSSETERTAELDGEPSCAKAQVRRYREGNVFGVRESDESTLSGRGC